MRSRRLAPPTRAARALCRQVQDPARVVPVLIGLSAHHIVAGEITTSRDVALEMLAAVRAARRSQSADDRATGRSARRCSISAICGQAHAHLGRGLELYDPAFHRERVWETGIEPGIFCRCEYSRTLTLLGFPDQGLAAVREAVAQARALDHPQPLAFALLFEIFDAPGAPQPARGAAHLRAAGRRVPRARHRAGGAVGGAAVRPRACSSSATSSAGCACSRRASPRTPSPARHCSARTTSCCSPARCCASRNTRRAQRALDDARAVAASTSQHAYDSEQHRLQAELLRRDRRPRRAPSRAIATP